MCCYFSDPFHAHILQICALHNESEFVQYVTPRRSIQKKAGEVNGIHYDYKNSKMTYKSKPVKHVSLYQSLKDLLVFLQRIKQPVLMAHNGKGFDYILIYKATALCGLLPKFKKSILGFIDSIPLCRSLLPSYTSFSLVNIHLKLVGREFDAHDAKEDCIALRNVCNDLRTSESVLKRFSFDWETVMELTIRDKPTDYLA